MVATLTTPRPATALVSQHLPRRVARVGRLAFGVMFAGGAAVHVAIVVTGTETYRHFADTAFIPFVKQAWVSVFMPHAALLGLLLAAFELAVGLLILAGGPKTRLGLLAAVAFHLLQQQFVTLLRGIVCGRGRGRCHVLRTGRERQRAAESPQDQNPIAHLVTVRA